MAPWHLLSIAAFVALIVPLGVRSQEDLSEWRCMTGHNYSSNWFDFAKLAEEQGVSGITWWYYTYMPDDSTDLTLSSCGTGFDACKTEILVHQREAYDHNAQAFVSFKSAEMVLSCATMDYCYPEDNTYMYQDPNTFGYHNEDHEMYSHEIRRKVECCNSDMACNVDESQQYANYWAAGSVSYVSLLTVVAAVIAHLSTAT